jgi:hypothetical protein
MAASAAIRLCCVSSAVEATDGDVKYANRVAPVHYN